MKVIRIGRWWSVALLAWMTAQPARAGMDLNGAIGTENYLGVRAGEFFDFRNANWFQLKLKAAPHEQVSAFANLELRNTNFTQIRTIDQLWDRGTLEPVSWRINEAYMDIFGFLLDGDSAVLDLRVGKQILGWGEGDGFNPSNKFDPLNLENPLDLQQTLGNVSLKAVLSVGDEWFSIEAVVVPRFLPSMLPVDLFLGDHPLDNPLMPRVDEAQIRRELVRLGGQDFADVPIVIHDPGYELLRTLTPGAEAENIMAGARVRWSMLGFDWAVSYAHARESLPVPRRVRMRSTIASPGQLGCQGEASCLVLDFDEVELVYPGAEVIGLNLRGSIWDIGVWGEAALVFPEQVDIETTILDPFGVELPPQTSGYIEAEPYTKWVIGAEYTFSGGYYLNLQWVHGLFFELTGHRLHDYLFLIFRKRILSDRLQFEVNLGGELDLTAGRRALGGLVNLNLSYRPFDGSEIVIGYVLARGQAGTTLEVFEPLDQVYLKFRATF